MELKNKKHLIHLNQGGITLSFFETGDIYEMRYHDDQINLLRGNLIDGTTMNLYLRVFEKDEIFFTKLIGQDAPSVFSTKDHEAIYEGSFRDIHYQVRLVLEAFRWDFHISISSEKDVNVDVIYGQDIAINHKGAVFNSEAYTVQYIDYKAFKDESGYTLCARQNQGKTMFLQLGSQTKNIAYATDGFQFFGLSYKENHEPEALKKPHLPSEIYQYEFSYFALQSEKINIKNEVKSIHFYGLFSPLDHDVIEKPEQVEIKTCHPVKPFKINQTNDLPRYLNTTRPIYGNTLSFDEVKQVYPVMDQIEMKDQQLLSFFSNNHHHIVLKEKELLVERPHGHLHVHNDLLNVSENVMAQTNFMFGLFSSHAVLGNTSFNKLTGDMRNPLNLHKISGLRIYIKKDGIYRLLGLPSLYDMGGVSSLWHYKLEDDTLIVKAYGNMFENAQYISFESLEKKTYDIILTEQILMGPEEGLYDIEVDESASGLLFKAPKGSMAYNTYPDLAYQLNYDQPYQRLKEKDVFGVEDQFGLLILSFKNVTSLNRSLLGKIGPTFKEPAFLTYEQADQLGTTYFEELSRIKLNHKTKQPLLNKLNHTAFWYTFQALVHYASPHGLEQYSGAAWGTRDVCQGPFELFMGLQRFDIARSILIKVYQRQFIENGDFPQWYMFDKYYQIQAHESHGDIIVWPLRALAYYIEATDDFDVLDDIIPFMSMKDNAFIQGETLSNHLFLQIKTIQSSFIPNTYLPRYGGGDWDDTLQPANHDLTTKMVSGWTVALLYDTLHKLGEVIQDKHPALSELCLNLSKDIQSDYEKHIIVDGIPAGFVIFDGEKKTYLLHPRDEKTGLKYRLLPFTRAIISEMVEPTHIPSYLSIINEHFKHPDGVRLMNKAVKYQGGRKTYFTRGETAANFGREIGLQYVHAHIRYIEAMAKIGEHEAAFEGLFTINPILLQEHVPNAYYRQSNMYFSSSDAWFKDRYEAYRDFEKVRKGEILVKGGWRLYSSGPGIYLHQLIAHVLGLRIKHQQFVIDPVLPKSLDGLSVDYHVHQIPVKIRFHYGQGIHLLNGKPFMFETLKASYRKSGISINPLLFDQKTKEHIIDYWFE